MASAIETEGLTKVYEKREGGWQRFAQRITRTTPVTAVTDVTLSVEAGELFGLLGPNGAGKTTLVKMLCTLILPTSGTATVAGQPLRNERAIRAATGLVVSDERSFYWRLSARRNLNFFAAMHGLHGTAARERVDAVLAEVDLLSVAERRFSAFSSGMKQRLAIARALLHRPQILFLDEPSRSLDPVATQRLHDLILDLMARQQVTIFLITHDLAEAEKLCARVALMHNGRIRTIGRPADLRRHLQPQQRYALKTDPVTTAVVQALRKHVPNLAHASVDGSTQLTFTATADDGTLTAVIDCLRRHDLAIHTVEGTPPTLEEVFTHYTKD